MLILFAQAATEGVGALGLDWKALVFQIINFIILLVILRFVAYRPILRILENRRRKIEESLRAGSEIEQLKKSMEQERLKMIQDVKAETQELLVQSKNQAETIVQSAMAKARERSSHVLEKAKQQADIELEQLKKDFRKNAVQLVAQATEHIISEKLDTEADYALIERSLDKAEKEALS